MDSTLSDLGFTDRSSFQYHYIHDDNPDFDHLYIPATTVTDNERHQSIEAELGSTIKSANKRGSRPK